MGFIQFVYTRMHGYSEEKLSDYGFQMIGIFLTDEVGASSDSYRQFILDPRHKSNTGNIMCIAKNGEDIILSFDSFMDLSSEQTLDWILKNDPLDGDETYTVSKTALLHVIEYWAKVGRMGCKEIWIKCEDGVYWVEGVDKMRR